MPPSHPSIARALGGVRRTVDLARTSIDPRTPLPVVVGCSGGPDSIALLGLLSAISRSESLELTVVHVDHQLRPESATEAALVRDVAHRLGFAYLEHQLNLGPGAGLARRARDARQQALLSSALEVGAKLVFLGHTATDQAETMLLHLCRGAGLEGLAAMSALEPCPGGGPAQGCFWVRPLLELTRTQTRALAGHLELAFCDDPTNLDLGHPRVRVRTQVLPVLRSIRPTCELAMAATATMAREAQDALEQWTHREVAERRVEASSTDPHFRVDTLHRLPRAVRTRFVRRVCTLGGVDPSALVRRVVDAVDTALLAPGPPRRWDLHPGRQLRLDQQRLYVVTLASI